MLDPANAALIRYVGVSYFETMRMVVSQGRAFDEVDAADAPARTIINEALATRLFPNGSPIGERLAVVFDSTLSLEIVGVVENVPQFALRAPAMEEFYIAHRQFPRRGGQLVARVAPGGPNVDQIREAVWEVAPNQPLTRMTEVASLVSTSIAPGRFQALLLGMFSALAVALAGIGIYGVLAETVSGRRRELGVRLAMGAQPASLVREVVGKGLRVALIGLVVGAVVAWGATRTLNSMLYGVTSRDPLTFVVASVFLLSVVLFSSWIPARRAARVDPVAALRAEA
jgi:putative ABC transport system permease protein